MGINSKRPFPAQNAAKCPRTVYKCPIQVSLSIRDKIMHISGAFVLMFAVRHSRMLRPENFQAVPGIRSSSLSSSSLSLKVSSRVQYLIPLLPPLQPLHALLMHLLLHFRIPLLLGLDLALRANGLDAALTLGFLCVLHFLFFGFDGVTGFALGFALGIGGQTRVLAEGRLGGVPLLAWEVLLRNDMRFLEIWRRRRTIFAHALDGVDSCRSGLGSWCWRRLGDGFCGHCCVVLNVLYTLSFLLTFVPEPSPRISKFLPSHISPEDHPRRSCSSLLSRPSFASWPRHRKTQKLSDHCDYRRHQIRYNLHLRKPRAE